MTKWVYHFSELGRVETDRAGGKGASLADLWQAGFPVPPGFIVSTAAYWAFLEANRLLPGVARPEELASAPVPTPIQQAVMAAYAELGAGRVAVRSSATVEDLSGASAAGQHESHLGLDGAEAVVGAVRRCWASLFSPRAITYRQHRGIPPEKSAMAVVVQRQVEPEASGVLFTAHPVSGQADRMVIEAVPGSGEALVSGRAIPDHYEVDSTSGETVGRPLFSGSAPILSREQLAGLTFLGRRAADHFGGPQDIEWALVGGKPRTPGAYLHALEACSAQDFWILQARPITTLTPDGR